MDEAAGTGAPYRSRVSPGGRLLRALLVIPVLLAGALAGLVGSFVHPLDAAHLPVGLLIALALSGSVFVTARALLGRPGAIVAAAGWLVAVLPFATQRPEGDLVVPATLAGYVWLLGGFLLALGCVLVAGPRREARPPGVPPSASPEARR